MLVQNIVLISSGKFYLSSQLSKYADKKLIRNQSLKLWSIKIFAWFSKMSTITQYDGFDVTLSVDGIRTIKLNRPKKKNALTLDMYSTLSNALTDANVDVSTKFVVLTGTGDYFSSGNDLSNFTNTGGRDPDEMIKIGGFPIFLLLCNHSIYLRLSWEILN